jgi:fluoride ion exporter CrcB/FEX
MTGLIPFSPIASDAAAIGVGAICGALCRHQIGKAATERISKDPKLKYLTGWHTAGINILGSFVLGGVFGTPLVDTKNNSASASSSIVQKSSQSKAPMVASTAVRKPNQLNSLTVGMTPRMKLLLGVGFCGSFTTFSTFSVDVVNMMSRGEMSKACSYLMVNNVGGVVAAAAGMMVVKKMFKV